MYRIAQSMLKFLNPIFEAVLVRGNSMYPTYKDGDIVFTLKFLPYGFGDVVLVEIGDDLVIKRLVDFDSKTAFILGDNLNSSTDSRFYGRIRRKQIVGKVIPNRKFNRRK